MSIPTSTRSRAATAAVRTTVTASAGARRVERAAVRERWADRWAVLVVLLATLACSALAVLWLTRRSAWYDEAANLAIAAAVRNRGLPALTGDAVMPGYHLMLAGWTALLGGGDAAARSLSVTAAAATVPVLALLARRLGGRTTAVAAAVVLATNASVVLYAEEASSYAVAMFATTTMALSLAEAVRRNSSVADGGSGPRSGTARPGRLHVLLAGWRWALVALLGACAGYTHVVTLLVVPALLIAVLAVPAGAAVRRGAAAAFGLWAVLVTPLLLALARFDTSTIAWVEPDQGTVLRRTMTFLAGGNPGWAAGAAFVIAVAVSLAWVRRSVLDGWQQRTLLVPLALAWVVVPLTASIALSLVVPVLVPRATLVCLPGAALLVGAAVDRVSPRRLGPVVLAAVVAVQTVGLAAVPATPSQTGWRQAAQVLARGAVPGDAVVVLPARERVVLEHYLPAAPGPEVTPSTSTVWVVVSTSTPAGDGRAQGGPRAAGAAPRGRGGLDARWEATAATSFERLTLTRYQRRTP